MAHSPAIKSPAEYGVNAAAARVKAMSVVAHESVDSKQGSPYASDSDEEDMADFAQQINAQTKAQYVKGKMVGSGTYANVYVGHYAADPKRLVAIKKIKIKSEWKDGLALDPIREIRFLQELSHPNIIALHAVFSSKGQNMNLVLEYLPRGDFKTLIKANSNIYYDLPMMKAWMGMITRGIWFCHENFILHRDIKPENVLVAEDGELKIADFGMARSFADPGRRMTYLVITSWYRPPELFYGARYYSGAVDIWSVGLVFAEMVKKRPLIDGREDLSVLMTICERLGSPTEENWPGVSKLDLYNPTDVPHPVKTAAWWRSEFGALLDDGADLLMSMLSLDPRRRPTARQILRHKFWTMDPRPARNEDLPKKAGGEEAMGDDLTRRGGEAPDSEMSQRGDRVARRLDFGAVQ